MSVTLQKEKDALPDANSGFNAIMNQHWDARMKKHQAQMQWRKNLWGAKETECNLSNLLAAKKQKTWRVDAAKYLKPKPKRRARKRKCSFAEPKMEEDSVSSEDKASNDETDDDSNVKVESNLKEETKAELKKIKCQAQKHHQQLKKSEQKSKQLCKKAPNAVETSNSVKEKKKNSAKKKNTEKLSQKECRKLTQAKHASKMESTNCKRKSEEEKTLSKKKKQWWSQKDGNKSEQN